MTWPGEPGGRNYQGIPPGSARIMGQVNEGPTFDVVSLLAVAFVAPIPRPPLLHSSSSPTICECRYNSEAYV